MTRVHPATRSADGCGYQEDADSGLKLLGHRYYDPSTGRFLTRDPAKDGRNWYGYCENNPICFVDPLGLWDWGATGATVGAAVGIAVGGAIVAATGGAPIILGVAVVAIFGAGGGAIGGVLGGHRDPNQVMQDTFEGGLGGALGLFLGPIAQRIFPSALVAAP